MFNTINNWYEAVIVSCVMMAQPHCTVEATVLGYRGWSYGECRNLGFDRVRQHTLRLRENFGDAEHTFQAVHCYRPSFRIVYEANVYVRQLKAKGYDVEFINNSNY